MIILIKEHPSAMGLRKTAFYKKLIKNSKIILVPFDVSSNEVINKADLVLTWTGSVGIEAIVRDKILVTFGEAYYDPGYGILQLKQFKDLSQIETILLTYIKDLQINTNHFKRDVLINLLKGLIPVMYFLLIINQIKTLPIPIKLNY